MEEILDEDFHEKINRVVTDKILLEIKQCDSSYPKYFIEVAENEIKKRNISHPRLQKKETIIFPKKSMSNWIRKYPGLAIISLLTSLFTGVIGFGIFWVTIYASIQKSESYKLQIWKRLNWLLCFLLTITILISLIIKAS